METETKKQCARRVAVLVILAAALLALVAANINLGSVRISLGEMVRILTGRATDATAADIVWKIRMPRLVAAVLLGGALSLSGFLLQTFFNNPIAGPYVLGVSSGAKLTVAPVAALMPRSRL